ncbi:MAG: TrmH family RNA methyltransferase [Erysipelotrichaceae bacterium]|nr:TrmH family RNA methyltransferase [Erysipelotrichaceae bacterium]
MQKYKKTNDTSYALGTELTLELLKYHPRETVSVYVHSKQKDNEIYHQIIKLCKENRIEVINSDKAFNIVDAKDNCYIMGVFKKFKNDIRKDKNHVVLVNPSNMGNLGTIIRSCVGFGLNDLAIIAPAADIYDPKVIRASMRAFFGLHFSYYQSFEEYLNDVSKREVFPFMLDGEVKLHEVKVPERYSLVFGNEATGLPAQFHEYGTSVVIEQLNTIDSFNLDNAVSIGIYEFTRGKLQEK